ncbi:adenylyltransferase/cytidyltransferase family protein [Geitlerinema sp. PCC 9228]|jgi:rfaE bifunctional protein nucleotidyltransferase chain/domain|uniref:adenylyltransferase/cytidyltransferase family protein n=1 Tax=Geitlerinema sp. PCC 9228 TaxID=111611 RepID=UPI0008F987C4|nr:adenylyltransferase/cytidyltransferase family protein [Geitlerinema sp. PCC 9228]
MSHLVYDVATLQAAIADRPQQWRPCVFTNGCFDLLHVGHVRYLQAAKAWGRTLIVGVNSDRSVRSIKPPKPQQPTRPLIPQGQRAEMVAALKPVDAVAIFEETTASHLIEQLQPDIYVKGGDYNLETLPEAASVRSYGGRIALVPIEISTSTTTIVNRILNFVELYE